MCVFCDIISGKIPCYKVCEDEKTLAFLDINQVNPGHTLVVPKSHYDNMESVPADDLCALMVTVKKVGALLKGKLNVPGYNLAENNDPVAGQVIQHLHFHVIPRHEGDGLKLWPQEKYKEGEAEEIIRKLTS